MIHKYRIILLPAAISGLWLLTVILLYIYVIPTEPQVSSDSSGYPWYIIETDLSYGEFFERVPDLAPEALTRDNVSVGLNRFGNTVEDVPVSTVIRLDDGDSRKFTRIEALLEPFYGEAGNMRLFVPRDAPVGTLQARLEAVASHAYIHIDQQLPVLSGLYVWAVLALILLLFTDERIVGFSAACAVFPLFATSSPMVLALAGLLSLGIRQLLVSMLMRYRVILAEGNGDLIPTPVGIAGQWRLVAYLLLGRGPRRPVGDIPRLVWLGTVGTALIISMIRSHLLGLVWIIPALALPLFAEIRVFSGLYREYRQHEHPLFRAWSLTPAWDIPPRSVRVLYLSMLAVIICVPLVFRLNSAAFPVRFIAPQSIGTVEDSSDLSILRTQVLSAFEARLAGEAPSEDISEVAEILADRAYQHAFPYLTLSGNQGAGRYENGAVILSRFSMNSGSIVEMDETIFEISEEWIRGLLQSPPPSDILQLYTSGKRWYHVRPEQNVAVLRGAANILIQVLFLLLLSAPFIRRRQFAAATEITRRLLGRRRGRS